MCNDYTFATNGRMNERMVTGGCNQAINAKQATARTQMKREICLSHVVCYSCLLILALLVSHPTQ